MAWWWAVTMIASPVLADAPAAKTSFDFSVGGVALTLPLPAGYCLPTGKAAAVAELIAAGDTNSVTHVTLKRCDIDLGTGSNDYTLIKTPTSALMTTIDRPALIKALGDQFADPVTLAQLAASLSDGKAGKDVSEVLHAKVEIKGDIKPLGHDDVCAYLGGQVNVKAEGAGYLQPTAVCITSVGSKVVTISRYGTDLKPAAIVSLMRDARQIAETLRLARAK